MIGNLPVILDARDSHEIEDSESSDYSIPIANGDESNNWKNEEKSLVNPALSNNKPTHVKVVSNVFSATDTYHLSPSVEEEDSSLAR